MKKENSSALDWQRLIRKLSKRNPSITEFSYFLNIAKDYSELYNTQKSTAKVILLGHFFPEEIIRALDIDFRCIFGGNNDVALHQSINLPKDTDDETRSIIGTLTDDYLDLNKDDVILLPLCNSNMKKIKSLLEDSVNVICYEVPSDKDDPLQQQRFANEIVRVTKELKRHFKKRLSSGKLKKQCEISKKAAESFSTLEALFKDNATPLSASAFLFIANSYRMCKDKSEWTLHLERLIDELKKLGNPHPNTCPEIMLIGSPVYAPTYKIIFAIKEIKLRLHTFFHPDIEQILTLLNTNIKSVSVKKLAIKYLESNISPVFINNRNMENSATNVIKGGKIKGIVANIIKGQIEYDYEFKSIERIALQSKIPITRLESVYNYHDIEQIRLRLEAFSEIVGV